MQVPKNSGRKTCDECYPEYNRQKAREHYKRSIETGKVEDYRRAARERGKLYHELDPRKRMVTAAKQRAKKTGLPFNITANDLVIGETCPILGTYFTPNTEYCASLDRIVPELGYVVGNVQVISMKANAMKNSANDIELLCLAKWIYENVPQSDD